MPGCPCIAEQESLWEGQLLSYISAAAPLMEGNVWLFSAGTATNLYSSAGPAVLEGYATNAFNKDYSSIPPLHSAVLGKGTVRDSREALT